MLSKNKIKPHLEKAERLARVRRRFLEVNSDYKKSVDGLYTVIDKMNETTTELKALKDTLKSEVFKIEARYCGEVLIDKFLDLAWEQFEVHCRNLDQLEKEQVHRLTYTIPTISNTLLVSTHTLELFRNE